MPFRQTGHAGNGLYVAGLAWSPCYVLDGAGPALFESGYSPIARLYEEDIRAFLAGREPEILFLTHVHYDHCGATSYLKRAFPRLKVAVSERSARILERPNAQKLMTELSRSIGPLASETFGIDPSRLVDEPFEPFGVDVELTDGQEIDVGGTTVRVIATPGHTRDMLSFYVPERKILIATEAVGVEDMMGHILVAPLADYDDFVRSLERLAALDVEMLCQGHHKVWLGREEVRDYFRRAMAEAKLFLEDAERMLGEEEGSIERVVARIKAAEYDTNTRPKQPEEAYVINLRARVKTVAARMKRVTAGSGRGS